MVDNDRLRRVLLLRLRLSVDLMVLAFLTHRGRRVGTLDTMMAPFISTMDQRAASVLSQEGSRGEAARWSVRMRAVDKAQTLSER